MHKNSNFCCADCGTAIYESETFRLRGSLSVMRHGRTGMNDQHIIIGSIDDPLCELGREQSRNKAEELKNAGERFDRIISSPYSRAFETANIVGAAIGTAVVADPRLRERCVGIYEGKPEFPGLLELFLSDTLIEGAESIKSLDERTGSILNDTARDDDMHMLFVTHALPLLKFMQQIKGWDLQGMLAYDLPKNCGVVKFRFCTPCLRCGSIFAEAVTK